VRALDFDDHQTTRAEPAGQPGAVTPGPFDAKPLERAKRPCPRHELGEPCGRRRDTPGTQASAELIERHPDVLITVRVDTHRDSDLIIPNIVVI
jgi:hypothetical protein